MATFRTHKNGDYSVISNIHLKDKTLSLKAKGLLSLMLSLPDNWDYSILGLSTLSKDGKDSVASALDELCKSGYVDMSTQRNTRGQYETIYDIYETPARETDAGKPMRENRCGFSESVNPPQYNINNNISPTINSSPNNENIILKKKENIKERENAFKENLFQYCLSRGGKYEDSMVEAFFLYWSETTQDGKKMRFELQKTWDTSKRLATWYKNNSNNGRFSSTQGQYASPANRARESYKTLEQDIARMELDLQ